jgi:hypothetical protein
MREKVLYVLLVEEATLNGNNPTLFTSIQYPSPVIPSITSKYIIDEIIVMLDFELVHDESLPVKSVVDEGILLLELMTIQIRKMIIESSKRIARIEEVVKPRIH